MLRRDLVSCPKTQHIGISEARTRGLIPRGLHCLLDHTLSQGTISNFMKIAKISNMLVFSFQIFPPPALPRNFRPFHSFEPSVSDSSSQPSGSDSFRSNRFTLSAPQRAAILGEEQLPGKKLPSFFLFGKSKLIPTALK